MEVQKRNILSHEIQEGGKLSHMTNEQKHTKSTNQNKLSDDDRQFHNGRELPFIFNLSYQREEMIGFSSDNDFLLFHFVSRIYKTTAQYNHLYVFTNTKDLLGRGCFYIIYTQGKIPCSQIFIRVLLTNTHKQKINKY